MKKLLAAVLFIYFIPGLTAFAQRPTHCLSDRMQDLLRKASPERVRNEKFINQQIFNWSRGEHFSRKDGEELIIPVVVHVIHQGGDENIADATIIAGIEHLNAAFSNTGVYFQEHGVDTRIRFCLAQQNPQGMPTSGITRLESELTNLHSETQDLALKSLVRWDPTQYLNIWLVNEISSSAMGSNVAGYAYFPSSHGLPEDGIVNEARWFGSSFDNSKVHIHEAGHYLGLYHTFNGACRNNDCLLDGDMVCDTPPDQSTAGVQCSSSANTCTTDSDDSSTHNPFRLPELGGSGDQNDLFVNYMDYGFQLCQNSFTEGQARRMQLSISGSRASLLSAAGCQDACGVYATGTNFSTLDLPLSAGNVVLRGFSERIVPYRFEWLENGVVVGTDSMYNFSRVFPGEYRLAFRIYNSELECYSEKAVTIRLRCGTQIVPPTFAPINPEPGQLVTFNSTTGAPNLSYFWYINGTLAGTMPSLNYSFPQAGENQVRLITSNGLCADTSDFLYVPVGSCNRGEALKWWFGSGSVLSFYGTVPVRSYLGLQPFTYANEGVSSICDANGNLVLICPGSAAYNGQGRLLENGDGLLAGNSSAQAALIVPNPSYNGLYFIFTTDHFGGQFLPTGGGLSYSIADMTRNNGLGSVIEKNIKLMEPTTERLAAVKHCNGHDFWLVSKEYGTNRFFSYRVTDAGVSHIPVISSAGTVHGAIGDGGANALGCMKISPQGDKLALTVHAGTESHRTFSELFSFDNSTGVVSKPVHLPADVYRYPYGLEFSPDGTKLYISNSSTSRPDDLFQYDLSSGHPAEIVASRTLIGTSSGGLNGNGSLQLAKNGSIYSARTGGNLDEIRFPNRAGLACGFIDNSVQTSGGGYSLSNQISSYAADLKPLIQGPGFICTNAQAEYSISCGHPGNTEWNYTGAGTMLPVDNSSVRIQAGSQTGQGMLTVSRDAGCEGLLYDTMYVHIGLLKPDLGNDTAICASGMLRLNAGAGYTSYLWSDGSTMSYLQVNSPGTYWVRAGSAGACSLSDTINVSTFHSPFSMELGRDTSFCSNTAVTIHAPQGEEYAHYQWSSGHTTPSVSIGTAMRLTLTVTNELGCRASDSILVNQNTDYPFFNFPDQLYLCPGEVQVLETGKPWMKHQWQDKSDQAFFTVWQPGVYTAKVTSACGNSWTDSVRVLPGEYPLVDLGPDVSECEGPFILNAGNPGSRFRWQDESSEATMQVNRAGLYYVKVTNEMGCSSMDSVWVDCPLGTRLNNEQDGVFLYPNPAQEVVYLRFNETMDAEIAIVNTLGQQVLYTQKWSAGEDHVMGISCAGLAAGMYIMNIQSGTRWVVKRFFVSN